jgi:phosphopantothenoylcysteine decarboxylase/phosphopantothenate--cysteine ligase
VTPTKESLRFVTVDALEVLSANECVKPIKSGAISHIEEAALADLFLIAPATCDLLAKMAAGLADELLLQTLLSYRGPILLAPAMESNMWTHASTQNNLRTLQEWGYLFEGPIAGELASGRAGIGRMSSPKEILERVCSILSPKDYAGVQVLLTAGPTREAIDPVRFLSNHSTGKMGAALAKALAHRGADVHVVHGPMEQTLVKLSNIKTYPVTTALEMHETCLSLITQMNVAILCAAVADFRPERAQSNKIKKNEQNAMRIDLVQNPDILRSIGALKKKPFLVGFAAESNDLVANAQTKCVDKQCDLICANWITGDQSAFASDKNEIVVVDGKTVVKEISLADKLTVAHQILDVIRERLHSLPLS